MKRIYLSGLMSGLPELNFPAFHAEAARLRALGFPPFTLRNNNANARRIKGRIAELEKRGQRENVEKEGNGYTYREDTKENRVMFVFPGKCALHA